MTLNGAIKQLHELRSAEDMPIYYKPAIAEVINVLLMDAREVKRGRWVHDGYDIPHGVDWMHCSIAELNARAYGFVEQDCYNEKCRNKIYELDPTYNSNNFTRVLPDPKITHFAGFPSRIYNKWPVVQQYMIGLD